MTTQRGPAFIPANLAAKAYATIAMPSGYESFAAAGLPASNLATEEPSEVGRITTLDPLATGFRMLLGKATAREVTGMSLVNVTLSPWGKYRWTIGAPTWQDLAATSIISSTNETGAVTAIDEAISAAGGDYATPSTLGDPWSIKTEHATPSTAPLTGTARGLVVARVSVSDTDAAFFPRCTCVLYQYNSILEQEAIIGNLGSRAVTGADQILIFPFDPADLDTASGAKIRPELTFTTDGSTFASLDSVRVYVERVAASQDSGWLDSPAAAFSDADDGPMPQISLPYWPATPWSVDDSNDLHVWFLDDQAEPTPDSGGNSAIPAANVETFYVSGFIDAGTFIAGEAFILGKGFQLDNTPAGVVLNDSQREGGRTIGGQSYASNGFTYINLAPNLYLTRDELNTFQTRIAYRKGGALPFYFASEPDIPIQKQIFNSGFYTLKSMGIPIRQAGLSYDFGLDGGEMYFSLGIELEAKL